jgi:hypothetical protein
VDKELPMMVRMLGPILVLVLGTGAAAQTTADPLAADLLRDWQSQQERILAMADAMPAEKYAFKATPEQRTFAEQLHHLAEAHVRMLKRLDPGTAVPAPVVSKDLTKEAVVKSLSDAYAYGRAVIEKASPLADSIGDTTKARSVWAALGNAQNHYGQCVVYLRLNGIVPPASRRTQ